MLLKSWKGFVLFLFLAVAAGAQNLSILRGTITDESGAIVPGAKVTVSGAAGLVKTAQSGSDGTFSISGLSAGSYTIQVVFPGLTQSKPLTVNLAGAPLSVSIQMAVAAEKQEVTVQESTGPLVSTDPANNAGALVLRGEDLQALSDDPDDLQSDLQALAGPAAGPNGGQIYIDGFTGGQLPNKDSIREIRINQNPFSPEYDKLGFGRIEILTKPGSDKFHGQVYVNYGDGIFNSRNPYAAEKAPFDLKELGGSLSGPVTKKSSFFFDFDERAIDNGAVIDGVEVNPSTFATNPFSQVLTSPFRRLRISPRFDYQLNSNNTLTVRYGYTDNTQNNAGLGGFNLPERAYKSRASDQTLQLVETAVLSTKVINETRFQYFHQNTVQTSLNDDPTVSVLSAFTSGSAGLGRTEDLENHYEIQNYTTIASGVHAWKFGVRVRAVSIDNTSPQGFNGSFSFAGGLICDSQSSDSSDCTSITSIQRYQTTLEFLSQYPQPTAAQWAQLQAMGGGPSQFSINGGNPFIHVGQVDTGLYVGDDWRVKPNLTLSLGLRYEFQTNIGDHHDWAPRLAFAWAPGSASKGRPKTVFRGGFGIFYDRFSEQNVETAERSQVQQQYIVTNPEFYPEIMTPDELKNLPNIATSQTIHEIDKHLEAPYILQSAIGIERQLPRNTTLAVTYTNSHGLHELMSRDINAPLPGSFPVNPIYPYGPVGPIYLMESAGLYNQNQTIVNINSRMNKNVSLFGFYSLNFARSNTDGVGAFPANQYSLAGEYGPASTDIRHRLFLGGSVATYWDLRLSPFVILQSGAPFNITNGQDTYDDTLFTARPGIVTGPYAPGSDLVKYGGLILDPNPAPGETILGRNAGRGPAQYTINLRLAKTFGFGPSREGSAGAGAGGQGGGGGGAGGGGGGPRGGPGGGMRMGAGMGGGPFGGGGATSKRYNLTFSISARNLLNHTNPGPIIGNLTSPLFGQANQLAGGLGAFSESANNRRIEFQMRFQF